ncbi:hypothetical protein ACU6U9_18370 [Pseudomonas sp. HK3]
MKEIISNTPFGSVWGYRFRQTVPALILLSPVVHYKWADIDVTSQDIFQPFLILTLIAFIFSFITEMLGDFIEGMIFSYLNNNDKFRNEDNYGDKSIVDIWFEYLNRGVEDKRIADLYISGQVDKLRLQSALVIPVFLAVTGFSCMVDFTVCMRFFIFLTGFLFSVGFIFLAVTTSKELIRLRDFMMSDSSLSN